MANVNSISLSGVVDDDPALMCTLEGKEILAFTLRVGGRVENDDGTAMGVDNFVACRVEDARAASLERVVRRGSHVALSGTMRQTRRIGTAQTRPDAHTRVIVDEIDVIDAPCSGTTMREAIGLNGYGMDETQRAGA